MSDASAAEPQNASSPGLVAAGLLGLALVAVGVGVQMRPLTATEAELVLAAERMGPDPAGLQAAWNAWAGTMPRALRGLAALSLAGALLGLFALHRRAEPGAARRALLALAAVPAVWIQGTGIAGGAPYLLGLLGLAAALRFFGLRREATAGLALVAAALLPFGLAPLDAPVRPALADADLLVASLPTSLAMLAALLVGLVLAATRRRPRAILALAGVAAWGLVGAREGLDALRPALPAAAGALALLAAATPSRPLERGLVLAALLGLAAGILAGPGRGDDPLSDRAGELDWITSRVDQRALLVHFGPEGALHRYLEARGHRTGHVSVRAAERAALRDWADRAVLDGLLRIAVTVGPTAPEELSTALGPRWREVSPDDAPARVRIFGRT